MTAFGETSMLAVDQVEFDVHPTVDDELVVHHDPVVDRMTNGTGAIADQSYADLAKLTINGSARDRVPLLAEVIELFQPTSIDLRLEIKANADRFRHNGLKQRIATALIEHDIHRRTTVTSFAIDTLICFRQNLPEVPLIWLIDRSIVRQIGDLDAVLRIATRRGICEIAMHENDLGTEQVRIAQALGLTVGAYAVNDDASIQRMFALGATVFTTNRPDLALKTRSEWRQSAQ
jgi:glycerophosphoryl diester phosphodiesterase